MKTGVILYIAGDEPAGRPSDPEGEVKALMLDADEVVVVSRTLGQPDVHDAWWYLVSKGMHRVLCAMAEYNPHGGLRLTGRSLRLCG